MAVAIRVTAAIGVSTTSMVDGWHHEETMFLVVAGYRVARSANRLLGTAEDNQPAATLTFYSRDPEAGDLTELGEFNIEGIAPAARGVPRIQVTVTVVETGTVVVEARVRDTGKSKRVEFGPVRIHDG